MNLGDMMLSEINQTQTTNTVWFQLHGQFIDRRTDCQDPGKDNGEDAEFQFGRIEGW